MKKIGKIALKEAQVMSDVEMKNVVGGSGIDNDSGYYGCSKKSLGQECYVSLDGASVISGICVQAPYQDELECRYR